MILAAVSSGRSLLAQLFGPTKLLWPLASVASHGFHGGGRRCSRGGVEAGGAHGDDLGGVAGLHGGDGVAGVDRTLEGVGADHLGDVADLSDVQLGSHARERSSCRWWWRGTGCGCSPPSSATSTWALTFSARLIGVRLAPSAWITLATPAICAAAWAAAPGSCCRRPARGRRHRMAAAAVTVLRVAPLREALSCSAMTSAVMIRSPWLRSSACPPVRGHVGHLDAGAALRPARLTLRVFRRGATSTPRSAGA
jgi:hypothetical protein